MLYPSLWRRLLLSLARKDIHCRGRAASQIVEVDFKNVIRLFFNKQFRDALLGVSRRDFGNQCRLVTVNYRQAAVVTLSNRKGLWHTRPFFKKSA